MQQGLEIKLKISNLMTLLAEFFPDNFKVSSKKTNKKLSKSYKKSSETKQLVTYAYPKVKKLPLETKRNVLSAMTHFDNVKGTTEQDKAAAYKKIIEVARYFEICTMGFKDKFKDIYFFEHEE
jgi:hypothetical protein